MEGIDLERRQARRNALRPLGISADVDRLLVSHLRSMGLEAEILALPMYQGDVAEMMTSGGDLMFIFGLSDFWGSDLFLP